MIQARADASLTRAQTWEKYAAIQADCLHGSKCYAWEDVEAWLGRNDLFYLLVRLLRRPDVNRDWLYARCREVEAAPNGYLDLWAREHYKSTIITFGKTIQDILNDPEITVGIFSHTRPIAKGFLSQIKRELEDNALLKHLYRDVLWADPVKEAPRWAEDGGIIVRREGNPKESTLEAWGLVDGMPTGKHFRLRVYDDIVTRESVTTPDMITKVTDAWDLSGNLGVTGVGLVRYIGTRYSLADTYAEMLKRKAVVPRVHAATHNGRIDGNPVFLSEQAWRDKLRSSSRAIIAAQQLQNPLAAEDASFRSYWLLAWEVRPRTLNVYILCDPSRGRTAESDSTAMAVVGIGPGGAKYLLDGYCHRMTLSERWTRLRALYRRWRAARGVVHVAVGYERYGAQSDDEYFQEQQRLDYQREKTSSVYFDIEELNWPREGGNSKRERVERLEPDFRNGRFYLPSAIWREGRAQLWRVNAEAKSKTFGEIEYRDSRGLSARQMQVMEAGSPDLLARALKCVDSEGHIYDLTLRFIEEYCWFPFGADKDLLDAVSRVYDMEPIEPRHYTPAQTEPQQHWDR